MLKISLAFMETKAREHLAATNKPEDRRYVRILAKEGKRRLEKYTHEPTAQEVLELFRTITYTDPVGDEAVSHVMDPAACGHGAARRLSLVAA